MNKKILLTIITLYLSAVAFAQDEDKKTLAYFEKYILEGNKPPDAEVQTQYEKDHRVIVWNDALIKDSKYSNEKFDLLGFSFVKANAGDNNQSSKVYRNCDKALVVEVTEWYGSKLSISMEWYSESVKSQISYLTYCYVKKQTDEEVTKGVYDLLKVDAVKKYNTETIDYFERKSKPTLNDGSTFLKDFYYEVVQKKSGFADECLRLILNKDGSKEFKTNWQKETGDNSANYKSYTTFIKNELQKLNFSNPKDLVFGDSLLPTTGIQIFVKTVQTYLGVIKVNYDAKNLSTTFSVESSSSEISFGGIGIQFRIERDTIIVTMTQPGGAAEAVGLLAEDRIVKVENNNVAGIGITNDGVRDKLRGVVNSQVKISVVRLGHPDIIDYKIKRSSVSLFNLEKEIQSENLDKYLTGKTTGVYKLTCFSVRAALEHCINAGNYLFDTSFIAFKEYEKGDEVNK